MCEQDVKFLNVKPLGTLKKVGFKTNNEEKLTYQLA
jgi:hypothetical protein